jgi:hypothetical protein
VIGVSVLQVNTEPENIDDLEDAVDRGHTDEEGWEMPKH